MKKITLFTLMPTSEVNCVYNFVIYRDKTYLAVLCTSKVCINYVTFVNNLAMDPAIILVKFQIFKVFGP